MWRILSATDQKVSKKELTWSLRPPRERTSWSSAFLPDGQCRCPQDDHRLAKASPANHLPSTIGPNKKQLQTFLHVNHSFARNVKNEGGSGTILFMSTDKRISSQAYPGIQTGKVDSSLLQWNWNWKRGSGDFLAVSSICGRSILEYLGQVDRPVIVGGTRTVDSGVSHWRMAAADALAREVRIAETCAAAQGFLNRFYKRLDEERHTVKNMYEEGGKVIFNGHGFEGAEAIGKLYENLPKSLTKVLSYDAHEIAETYLKGAPAILILVTGRVKYGGSSGESRSFDDSNADPRKFDFYETFVISAKSGTWKIQSDNFRHQNCNTDSMLKSELWSVGMQE
ncbi:hypothetical protein RvY_03242 [Ramazzottius varieornatus]|uniref:NTF2 domain-containing protein n=1 Tax=Ramazzottius varieornatus TaxID=947166 RepID=A0A1D1UMF1_RAMVA|nr:hypothetical protein RvY_03242 [Ramazzottius varieornatus]